MQELQQLPPVAVSVIVPTFNRRQWIGECLDSILAQTYPNKEIVVVDDCSTDGTVDWLRTRPEYREVVILELEKNGGASIARNRGIAISKGELIVFIDSDDMLLPKHLETAVAHFDKFPDLGLFCCDSKMIDADGRSLGDDRTWHDAVSDFKRYPISTGFRSLEDVFSFSNCFPGFTLRRKTFDELGGFDQAIFPADDYDLALRVAASEYQVFYLHEPLCLRREHDGQLSGLRNSTQTCSMLARALSNVLNTPRGSRLSGRLTRRRIADIRVELGLGQIKEGSMPMGALTVAGALLRHPPQAAKLARIGLRKIKIK